MTGIEKVDIWPHAEYQRAKSKNRQIHLHECLQMQLNKLQ